MTKKNKAKIFKQNLRSYRIKILAILVISSLILLIIFFFSLEKVLKAVRSLKQIQSIIENKLQDINEELEFKDGSFYIKIPHYNDFFLINAKIKSNQSTEISFTSSTPYQVKGFLAEVYLTKNIKENWKEKLEVKSDFADISKDSFKIKGNVYGLYNSKINPNFNKTIIFADWIKIVKSGNTNGEKLFLKNAQGVLTAGEFFLIKNSGFANFSKGVMIENEDYKVNSQNLETYLLSGSIQSLHFKQNVVFRQKTGEKSIVYGDNAVYNQEKSQIYIYGNVYAKSSQNNTKVKGESFNYNTKTKVGQLMGGKTSKERVSVELEI